MSNLQDILDKAHTAAGLPAQREFKLSEHFEEKEPDTVVQQHTNDLQKKAEQAEHRRQVCLGMNVLLAAADSLVAARRA